jgi:hypothetical protein
LRRASRRASSGVHAGAEIFFDSQFQVGGHLRFEVLIELRAVEEGSEALKGLTEPGDHDLSSSPGIASTRVITLESLCQ